jgi:hypothetical protein
MSDPYWKSLFIFCLYLAGVALAIWWSVDISESFIKSDIANYISKNGLEPTREIAEELRKKSAFKRIGISGLVIIISNYVFMKFIYKPKSK